MSKLPIPFITDKCTIEQHPFIQTWTKSNNSWIDNDSFFGYLQPGKTKFLIIGTFPPPSVVYNLKENFNFFYSSPKNEFWRIINLISTQNYFERDLIRIQKFLNYFLIGITDILRVVKRNKFLSSDSNLSPICYNSLNDLLKDYSDIIDIYFTSAQNSKKNAFGWFYDQLKVSDLFPNGDEFSRKRVFQNKFINIFNRRISLHFLYSPSPSARLQIYNGNKTTFYDSLCSYFKINCNQLTNIKKSQMIVNNMNKCNLNTLSIKSNELYVVFQWLNEFAHIKNFANKDILKILREIDYF